MASRLSIENDRLKVGQVKRVTLRDLVIAFKDAYNQIIANESEGTNS